MPLMHCQSCHHEWEAPRSDMDKVCMWCGAPGYVLEAETSFERFVRERGWEKIGPWSVGNAEDTT